jgi:hypothetical protein
MHRPTTAVALLARNTKEAANAARSQSLTLVHFPAQTEPFFVIDRPTPTSKSHKNIFTLR